MEVTSIRDEIAFCGVSRGWGLWAQRTAGSMLVGEFGVLVNVLGIGACARLGLARAILRSIFPLAY